MFENAEGVVAYWEDLSIFECSEDRATSTLRKNHREKIEEGHRET